MTVLDPVCGMPVGEATGVSLDYGGQRLRFCSEFCKEQFLRHPSAYEAEVGNVSHDVDWPRRRVAYFSMEMALANEIPTYAGGLGVLAGDTLRSCADLEVPIVGVSLIHRKGYFRQEIRDDWQFEQDGSWEPERILRALEPRVTVTIEGRSVQVRAWEFVVAGSSRYAVPVLLLDTDLPDNRAEDRRITDRLYGGDERYRLMQEIVLGVGGVRMLQAMGCTGLQTFHLNEGHAALAPLELLRTGDRGQGWDFRSVRNRTVFTTHTPIAAGHDQFDPRLVHEVLGDIVSRDVFDMLGGRDRLNMTHLALNLSHYVNGVALRHREVSSELFPDYEIHQVTNGVHSRTWTSQALKTLFDRYIPGWRDDPFMLRNATALPPGEVWQAHQSAKDELLDVVFARSGRRLRRDALTIGFARRATAYKRADLVLSDVGRLRAIAKKRPLQMVFAGKAHPKDDPGKRGIRSVLSAARQLGDDLPIVYLNDYDLELGLRCVAGVDLWLNTPLRPLEASGTSGMKAAHNGVPSFSVLDGWWREGHVEGVTGWAIGPDESKGWPETDQADAADLYRKLEHLIAPRFYEERDAWVHMMQQCIALNASFFNTHRMVRQYLMHAYSVREEQ
jgi:glycogen phosphorylase